MKFGIKIEINAMLILNQSKMKSIFRIAAGAALAVTMLSCGAANDPYYGNGGNYPGSYPGNYPQGRVYRAGDGTVYRAGDVYRDNNGNVYQNGQIIRTGDIYGRPGVISGGSYGNRGYGRQLPPGQAKKVYGGRAKDYAPGQMKKRDRYYENRDYRDYRQDRDYRDNDGYKKNKKHKDREDD